MKILIILLFISVLLLIFTLVREKKQKMAARGRRWSWSMFLPFKISLAIFLMIAHVLLVMKRILLSTIYAFQQKFRKPTFKHEEPTFEMEYQTAGPFSNSENYTEYQDEPYVKVTKKEKASDEDADVILGLKSQPISPMGYKSYNQQTQTHSHIQTQTRAQTHTRVQTYTHTQAQTKKSSPAPKHIMIYLKAPKGFFYGGYDLLQTLLTHHFRFGEMDIFHRHETSNGQGNILFSLAAATKEGTFDLNHIGRLNCNGLTMFLTVSKQKNPLHSFNLMIETAHQLISDLGGDVLDFLV